MSEHRAGLRKPGIDIRDYVNELHATGDRKNNLVVQRGPLSQDSDASWQQVMAIVQEDGMVLVFEGTRPSAKGDRRMLVYTVPEGRFVLNDTRGGPSDPDGTPRPLRTLRAVWEGMQLDE
jgi:hypothetical protein